MIYLRSEGSYVGLRWLFWTDVPELVDQKFIFGQSSIEYEPISTYENV